MSRHESWLLRDRVDPLIIEDLSRITGDMRRMAKRAEKGLRSQKRLMRRNGNSAFPPNPDAFVKHPPEPRQTMGIVGQEDADVIWLMKQAGKRPIN